MNKNVQIVAALLLVAFSLSARADVSVFGNSPNNGTGFSLVAYNGLSMSGGAVEFTPEQNIDLGSVSLWLSGYTGQFGQSIYASIWANFNNTPSAPYINLSSAAPNNGSLAAFTFSNPTANLYSDPSGSTVLSAGIPYWLVVTAGEHSGGPMMGASWVGGSAPAGVAIFDGADNYNVSGASFNASSALPAFSINNLSSAKLIIQEVPEPGSLALTGLALLFGMGCLVYKRWKAHVESLKLARVKVTSPSPRKRA